MIHWPANNLPLFGLGSLDHLEGRVEQRKAKKKKGVMPEIDLQNGPHSLSLALSHCHFQCNNFESLPMSECGWFGEEGRIKRT